MYRMINHYNDGYYWSKRFRVVDGNDKSSRIKKQYWLFRLKMMEAYNGASLGTYMNRGAIFAGKPILPHGLRGIHISDKAVIGSNCVIFQQCVIGVKNLSGGAPKVGNNCVIGAGAMLLGEITIGDNVKIGANCVVDCDIVDNATVVSQKPRIILKKKV